MLDTIGHCMERQTGGQTQDALLATFRPAFQDIHPGRVQPISVDNSCAHSYIGHCHTPGVKLAQRAAQDAGGQGAVIGEQSWCFGFPCAFKPYDGLYLRLRRERLETKNLGGIYAN